MSKAKHESPDRLDPNAVAKSVAKSRRRVFNASHNILQRPIAVPVGVVVAITLDFLVIYSACERNSTDSAIMQIVVAAVLGIGLELPPTLIGILLNQSKSKPLTGMQKKLIIILLAFFTLSLFEQGYLQWCTRLASANAVSAGLSINATAPVAPTAALNAITLIKMTSPGITSVILFAIAYMQDEAELLRIVKLETRDDLTAEKACYVAAKAEASDDEITSRLIKNIGERKAVITDERNAFASAVITNANLDLARHIGTADGLSVCTDTQV